MGWRGWGWGRKAGRAQHTLSAVNAIVRECMRARVCCTHLGAKGEYGMSLCITLTDLRLASRLLLVGCQPASSGDLPVWVPGAHNCGWILFMGPLMLAW